MKNNFRHGFAFLFILLSCVSFFPFPVSAEKLTIKCQTLYPATLPQIGDSIYHMAKDIEIMSDGQIELKIYEPGKLFKTREILRAVSDKVIGAGYASAGFWRDKMPAASYFGAVPFGPDAPEFLAWILHGNGMKLYQEMYDKAGLNIIVFPVVITTAETSGWFSKPMNSIEDFKDLKIRFFGLGAHVMRELGALASPIAAPDIIPALEKGMINATEFSCPNIDRVMGFNKVAVYNYFPGWHQQATLFELLLNKDIWNAMSKSRQKMIETATRAALLNSMTASEAAQGKVIKTNAENLGVKNMYWSDEMLSAFKKAWDKVEATQAGQDPFFKKVMEDLKAFRADYKHWAGLGFLPRPEPEPAVSE